ncbi:MAG: hypothetical protein ACR2G5_02030 [Pyrinomonadaceae bacterium]
MLSRQRQYIVIFLLVVPMGIIGFASEALAQKARTQAVVYATPSLSLTADQSVINACQGETLAASLIHLKAKASSPGGNPIRYRWTSSAGRIDGDGPAVTWNLSGVQPGYYKASLEINTGSDDEACEAFSSTTVLIVCPAPVCPNVLITCPDRVVANEPLTFSATATGGSGNVTPVYRWTVSGGRIIQGEGTTSIKVDTTGLGGQTIKATFSVDGYPQVCSASCGVQTQLPVVPSRKFDEFPSITRNDEKARLDNFAIELKNDPTSTGYVIVYPGQSGRTGDVQKHTSRIVNYLVNYRGIDARRIVTLTGATRAELLVELWVSPQGATPPSPAR